VISYLEENNMGDTWLTTVHGMPTTPKPLKKNQHVKTWLKRPPLSEIDLNCTPLFKDVSRLKQTKLPTYFVQNVGKKKKIYSSSICIDVDDESNYNLLVSDLDYLSKENSYLEKIKTKESIKSNSTFAESIKSNSTFAESITCNPTFAESNSKPVKSVLRQQFQSEDNLLENSRTTLNKISNNKHLPAFTVNKQKCFLSVDDTDNIVDLKLNENKEMVKQRADSDNDKSCFNNIVECEDSKYENRDKSRTLLHCGNNDIVKKVPLQNMNEKQIKLSKHTNCLSSKKNLTLSKDNKITVLGQKEKNEKDYSEEKSKNECSLGIETSTNSTSEEIFLNPPSPLVFTEQYTDFDGGVSDIDTFKETNDEVHPLLRCPSPLVFTEAYTNFKEEEEYSDAEEDSQVENDFL